ALDGPAAGLETYREGMAFSSRRGMDGPRIWSSAESTYCLYDLGLWDELLALADEVQAESQARNWTQPASFTEPQRAKVLYLRGDLAAAVGVSAAILPAAQEVGDPQLLIPALEVQALLNIAGGRPAQAIEAIVEIERITAETTPLIFSFAAELIRIACRAGDSALAHRLADGNPAMPGRSDSIVVAGRAVIAETEGRLDEAASGHRDAADRWAAYGSVPEQGLALVGQGRCLIALGRAGEARDSLQNARELFAGLGAVVPVAEVDDLLAQATARAS
ncbi:MAG: hypothetical protein ACRDFR_07810, partial [Candidatus Limnocylindria bacterium]